MTEKKSEKIVRNYKDSVFTDLFYKDENARKNLLQLYNALFDDNLTDENEIVRMRLENTIYIGLYNDICFDVKHMRIVLMEHQSTINENIPLRMLLYIARELEQYFPKEVRYRKKRAEIPTPQFIVFYNGQEEEPAEREMRLSDMYIDKTGSTQLELVVRIINITMRHIMRYWKNAACSGNIASS